MKGLVGCWLRLGVFLVLGFFGGLFVCFNFHKMFSAVSLNPETNLNKDFLKYSLF